jgi:hypothetical protein
MSDEPQAHSPRWPGGRVLAPFVIMLYLLSTGPICRLQAEGIISDDNRLLETLYLPLRWAMQSSELVRDAVFLYLSLWGVRIS